MPLIKSNDIIPEVFVRTGCSKIDILSGQVLFYEKFQPIGYYYLLSGKVKIMKELSEGREKMMGILTGGQFLGVKDYLSALPYKFTAIALDSTQAIFISHAKHSTLIKESFFSTLLSKTDVWRK